MPGTIEQEILTQEENLTQAKRQLDISAFDRIYADDVMFTGVTGEVCGKAGLMTEAARGVTERDNAAAQGKKFVASLDKEDIKVVTHCDTAVTSYRFVVRIQGEGVEIHHRYRTTNVWLKRENQWQIIAGHMASLDPQGAR
jgi:ketosteroid isomerase-like protein